MKKLLSGFLTNALIGCLFLLPVAAFPAKIQQQGIVTATDCSARGIANSSCLPLSSQLYDTGLGDTLDNLISSGQIGGGGSGGINLLQSSNPGFESGVGSWTASGGTLSSNSVAANVGVGNKSAKWITTAGAQTLSSALIPIKAGLYNQNGLAYCRFQTAATDFTFAVSDGSTTVKSVTVTGSSAAQYVLAPLFFIMPSSGSLKIVITSASAQTVYVDDCYIGNATVIGSTNAIEDWNSSRTVTINGAGTISNLFVLSKRIGDEVHYRGIFTVGTAAASTASISLGNSLLIDSSKLTSTTNLAKVGEALVPTSASSGAYATGTTDVLFYDGSDTAKVYFASSSSSFAYTKANASSLFNNAEPVTFDFTVPIAGYSSPGVLNTSLPAASFQGRITGCTGSNTYASTSYGDFPLQTGCTNTDQINVGFGTVSAASVGFGESITFTSQDTYKICSTASMSVNSTDFEVRIVDDNGTPYVINETAPLSPAGGSNFLVQPLCGLYKPYKIGSPITFKWQAKSLAGATVTFRQDLVTWSVEKSNATVPNVVFGGMPIMTASQSYSLAFTGSTTNPTFGTVTNNSARYKRIGENAEIHFDWKETTAGTAGSGTYLFSIPSGLTIDTSKVPADTSGNLGSVGSAGLTAFDGTTTYIAECFMFVYDTTHLAAICSNDTTNSSGHGAGIWGSTYISLAIQQAAISFNASVPISGWAATN